MTGRGRGKEVSLQAEIENQEEWEEQMAKEGLLVVDVFQDWCGPCRPMLPVFKRLNNESGDELLRFATAKSDTIDALDRYRGKCEPIFLLYAGGVLVESVHGADGPTMSKAISEQLAVEHSVLETGGTRLEFIDSKYPPMKKVMAKESAFDSEDSDSPIDDQSTDEEEEERKRLLIEKEMAVLVVAPVIYNDKTIEELNRRIKSANFDVTYEQEIETTEEDLSNVLPNYKLEEGATEVDISRGVSAYIFVLTKGEMGKNVIQEMKEFVGPEDYSLAKEFAPLSMRAIVGKPEIPLCGLITADNIIETNRLLKEFAPMYVTPKISVTNIRPARDYNTVGYVRPTLWETKPSNLFTSMQELGFKVVLKKELTLEEDHVHKLYKHLALEPYYDNLVETMLSGPGLVMLVSNNQPSVVNDFRDALGPFEPLDNLNVLRGKFRVIGDPLNQLDGSISNKAAEKEKRMFFPLDQSLLLIKPNCIDYKDQILNHMKDEGYIVAARKILTLTDEQIISLYAPYKFLPPFNAMMQSMNKSPSCFIVLSRVLGLERLKTALGYKTRFEELPEEEEEEEVNEIESLMRQSVEKSDDSDSFNEIFTADTPAYYPDQFENLSQVFGLHMPENCLHISETVEQSTIDINTIFGPLKFHRDGFVAKAKKAPTTRICDAKAPKISTYEEVYEEIDKMPRPVKVDKVEVEDEYERQHLEFLKMEAFLKEKEKDEAKEIYDAKFLEETGRWGTVVEYPVEEETRSIYCCPEEDQIPKELSQEMKEAFADAEEIEIAKIAGEYKEENELGYVKGATENELDDKGREGDDEGEEEEDDIKGIRSQNMSGDHNKEEEAAGKISTASRVSVANEPPIRKSKNKKKDDKPTLKLPKNTQEKRKESKGGKKKKSKAKL